MSKNKNMFPCVDCGKEISGSARIDNCPFFCMSFIILVLIIGSITNKRRYGWEMKDYSSTVGTFFVWIPFWTVFVISFIAPLSVHRKFNNLWETMPSSDFQLYSFLIWAIGYFFFLKITKLI